MKLTTAHKRGRFYLGYRRRGTEAPTYDPRCFLFKLNKVWWEDGGGDVSVCYLNIDIYHDTARPLLTDTRYDMDMNYAVYMDEWITYELTEEEVRNHILMRAI